MAKSESRYIQFYSAGSVACKVELRQEQEWAPLPKAKPVRVKVITIDPVAVLGCVVAVCMLALMAFGIGQLNTARQEVVVLESYVASLTAENLQLKQEYAAGYDPEVIRQKALDMGMIPAEQVPIQQIRVPTAGDASQPGPLESRWKAFVSSLQE